MSKGKDLTKLETETSQVLTDAITAVAEGLTGIGATDRKELITSLGHIFQRMRGGYFLSNLLEEWNRYREKGKVKDDYQYSEQHQACLQELLDSLDNDSLDDVRFSVLKQIFLVAASEEQSDRDSFLPQQFMKIVRSLTQGEVLLLTAIWNIVDRNVWDKEAHHSAVTWLTAVTPESGLRFEELVEIHEKMLIDKRLISPRQLGDGSGVIIKPHFRLTDLGYELCRFISSYEA